MGRGGDYQGIWISKVAPPSSARIQDTFLSLTRKHLMTPWESVKLDQLDRIISIKSLYYGKYQYFLYFWNGIESYFLQQYFDNEKSHWVVHKSWDSQNKQFLEYEINEDELFLYFDEVGRKNLPDKSLLDAANIQSVFNLQLERYLNKSQINMNSEIVNKKHQRKLSNIKKDLTKLAHFNELKKFLDTNPVFIPLDLVFGELKIKFPPESTLEQRRNLAYIKFKNWKKNFTFMQERLEREESIPVRIKAPSVEKIIKPIWKSPNHAATKKENLTSKLSALNNLDNCKFFTLDQFRVNIAIGKSANANDQLRNSWSKKTDYWFHLADMPSAHLYVRPLDGLVINQDFFNTIGTLLLKESGYTLNSATLLYCFAKDLKAVKGSSGTVKYKNEKRVLFFLVS